MAKKLSYQALENRVKELEKIISDQAPEEWRQTFDALPDLIMILDDQHRIVRANKSMADRLGMDPQEMVGLTCCALVHGRDIPLEFCPHGLSLLDHQSHFLEVREDRLKGDFLMMVSPLILSKDGRQGSVHVARDITQHKKAQETLALNESRFRDISLSMADWIWELDSHGRFVFSAGNLKKVLGYEPHELTGKTPFDFMPEEEAVKIRARLRNIVKNRLPIVDLKNWNLKKEGTRVCLLTNGVPMFDKEGEFKGYRGVDKDITRYLEIEERLKQSLETTEKIIDNIPIGMFIIDKNKVIQRINKAGLALTGYDSKDEVVGHGCHKIICDNNPDLCPILDQGKRVDHSERTLIQRDGRQLSIYKTALPLEIDGQEVIIEAFMDISSLKRAETDLRESKERFRTLMETLVDPVGVYDVKGRITYLNPAFTRVFGWTLEELQGKEIHFMPLDKKSENRDLLARVHKGDRLSGVETRRTTRNGQEISVRLGAALFLDTLGQPKGIVVNYQDITREKEAHDQLNRMNQALEKSIKKATTLARQAEVANTAKSEFLANMSHEIRTPLNGVIGMTDLLLDTDLSVDQRHYAHLVQTSGESLLTVINAILDFSKIEAGKLEMEIIDFDLRSLLDDFAAMMALRIQKKNLEFICGAAPEVPALLQGDPGRLRQVLVNLVDNALKFTFKGEISVQIHVKSETPEQVELLFSIQDTGIGIPQEKHELLFQSFTQADTSITRKFGGTGLGLTISKKLCHMMGGEIGLTSQVGKGSDFWFTACFEKQKAPLTPLGPTPPPDIRDVHILVVDDNDTNRQILVTRLNSWGCRTRSAPSGPRALDLLYQALEGKDAFDMAILDMQMPGMDGLTLGRAIKADARLSSTHLVMMTSMGQVGDARRFEKTGFAAYLIKPVGHSNLLECLSTILSGPSKPRQTHPIITRHTVRELQRKKIQILLAEDNIINQQVITGILAKFGFMGVTSVFTGAQVLKALKKDRYDLVLMDVQMPEMDGLEATRQIRNLEANSNGPKVPIIAITAHARQKDQDTCLAAGMDDYVSKPIDPKILFQALERWLPRKKSPGNALDTRTHPNITLAPPRKSAPLIFDQEALMTRVMHDQELVKIVVAGFLQDMPKQIQAVHTFVREKNMDRTIQQGHQMKGAAANLGAEALREIASNIENAGKSGDSKKLALLLPQLDKAFDQFKHTLEKMSL